MTCPWPSDPSQEDSSYRLALTIPRAVLVQSSGFCCIRFDTHKTAQLTQSDICTLEVAVRQIVFE
jgi:hypothetical protein